MDKTIKINLGGSLFQIDEEAYRMLRDYLQTIDTGFRNVPGGYETIEDIESRIAEIFLSQKDIAGVITKTNVEAMISIIGKPEDFDYFENKNSLPPFSSRKKRMFRNPDDSIIGGVCSGIGAYLGTDSVWIRILFILLTIFFGVGFFLYCVLWIALPKARTDIQKKEMYGNTFYSAMQQNPGSAGYSGTSRLGNAFNEVFKASGKAIFILLRVILIIIGTTLVLTGFLSILSFVMVFLFKYPGSFSTNIDGVNLSYIPDFLNFIVAPSVVPWITILTSVIVILPMLALIYWGVKMIFWFRAKDGVFSLTGFVLWVMSVAALSIILFNEGVSYTESAKTISSNILKESPDTLYFRQGKRIEDLKYDHEISIPHENYYVFIAEDRKEVFVRTFVRIENSGNNNTMADVRKRSTGRSRTDALQRAEALQYNFRQVGDTLFFDEYFSYPPGTKWAFDNVGVTLRIPEGTLVNMDINTENMINPHHGNYYDRANKYSENGNRFWKITEEGFRLSDPEQKQKQK